MGYSGKVKKFDPEGSGYDDAAAADLIKQRPLTISKPTRYQGGVVRNKGSFQVWKWYPKLNEYKKHSGSRNSKTGQILKGRTHKTYHLTEKGEADAGYEIYKGKDGKYYSKKKTGEKMAYGKIKRTVKELVHGKKTYLSKERIAEDKKLKGLTKRAKAKRVTKAKQPKGDRAYRGASGSDLKELEKKFGKKR